MKCRTTETAICESAPKTKFQTESLQIGNVSCARCGTRIPDESVPHDDPARRFYASWCINRRVDGGLELPPKVVQERLGHSTIAMTLDIYGHLFPRHDDSKELAAAERALLAEPRRKSHRQSE